MGRKGKLLIVALAFALPVLAAGASSAGADTVTPIPGPSVVYQMLVDSDVSPGYIFIVSSYPTSSGAPNSLLVTDLDGQDVTTSVGGTQVDGIALSPDGSTLYALSYVGLDTEEVAAIDVSTITNSMPTQTIYHLPVGDLIAGMAVQSGKLWLSYTNGPVGAFIGDIDLTTGNFEAQPAAGTWSNVPDLAADPSNSGVVVAVTPGLTPAAVATFNTTTDPVTPLAAQMNLGTVTSPVCANENQIAVLPGGQEFILACQNSANAYQTKDLTIASSYATSVGTPGGVAVDADGTVAVGTYGTPSAIYVYKSGAVVNIFNVGPSSTLVDRNGLAWEDLASGPRLAAMEHPAGSGPDSPHSLQVFDQPETTNSVLTLTTPSTAVLGGAVTLTGSLTLTNGAPLPPNSAVTVTREGAGGTITFPPLTPGSDGSFTMSDTPAAAGAYSYTASYAGVANVATAATTSASVTVSLNTARLSLSGRTSVFIGRPVTITGTLAFGTGAVPAGTQVTITRTASGTPSRHFTVSTGAGGTFKLTDEPAVTGSYTYSADYAGDSTTDPATASRKVSVDRIPTALTLTTGRTTVTYEPTVHVEAHLGATYHNRVVSIYAQRLGSRTRTRLRTGKVDSHGNLTVSYRAAHSTTFTVVFAGDPHYAPRSITRTVGVRAKVTQSVSGYYGTTTRHRTTYHLFHSNGRVNDLVSVAPDKRGQCVNVEVQEYYQGTWNANTASGCIHLSRTSQLRVVFRVNHADHGIPYRMRADYTRKNSDVSNLSNDSSWFYVLVET